MIRIFLLLWNRNYLQVFRKNKLQAILLFLTLFWYGTAGFLYFELPVKPDLKWVDAVWWTIVTMTTVGYGDYFPVTHGGRFLIAIPTMIIGIGFLGFIISEIAAKLIESNSKKVKGMLQINLKNHILIINYNTLEKALQIVEELKNDPSTKKKNICLIDENLEELPVELLKYDISFVRGNPANELILKQANILHASHAVILSKDPGNVHSDDQNLSTILIIEHLHPEIFSISEVIDPKKINQFKIAGCNSIICVSELSSSLIIQELQDPGVNSVIHEITSNQYGQQIYLANFSSEKKLTYRDFILWGMNKNYSILGIFREEKPLINCSPSLEIKENDSIIVIGENRIDSIII